MFLLCVSDDKPNALNGDKTTSVNIGDKHAQNAFRERIGKYPVLSCTHTCMHELEQRNERKYKQKGEVQVNVQLIV